MTDENDKSDDRVWFITDDDLDPDRKFREIVTDAVYEALDVTKYPDAIIEEALRRAGGGRKERWRMRN